MNKLGNWLMTKSAHVTSMSSTALDRVSGLSKAGHYQANTLSNKLKRRKDDRKPVWITLRSDYDRR